MCKAIITQFDRKSKGAKEALSRWIDKARDVSKEYKSNLKELRQLEEYLNMLETQSSDSPGVASGKISKPVEAAVERKMMLARYQYLKQAITSVEIAMTRVQKKPQGDLTIKLFNMVYYNRSHTLYGAAQSLAISEVTAKRYNRFLLKEIAFQMGFIASLKK